MINKLLKTCMAAPPQNYLRLFSFWMKDIAVKEYQRIRYNGTPLTHPN